MGTLSRIAFFTNFAMFFLHSEFVALASLAFALPTPASRRNRNQLWQHDMTQEGSLVSTMVKSFSPKGKRSRSQNRESSAEFAAEFVGMTAGLFFCSPTCHL